MADGCAGRCKCSLCHGRRGILSALWKVAEASQVGLEMDFPRYPYARRQLEICEIFDINPYKAEFGRGLF